VISDADAALAAAGNGGASNGGAAGALRLLLPLLVQDGSRLLHRHLLTYVRRLPGPRQEAAGAVISDLMLQAARRHLEAADAAAPGGDAAAVPGWVRPGLSVSQAGASLTMLPTAAAWLAPAAAPLLRLSARGVGALIGAADAGAPLSPALMDQLQEAITLMIFLLSNHGRDMAAGAAAAGPHAPAAAAGGGGGGGGGGGRALRAVSGGGGDEGEAAVFEATEALLAALHSQALVREGMASAAVGLWHAALLPAVPPAAAALAVVRGLELDGGGASQGGQDGAAGAALRPGAELEAAWLEGSLVEALLAARAEAARGPGAAAAARRAHGSCLAAELADVGPLGRLCAVKGLLMALPAQVLCCDLNGGAGGASDGSWCVLIDGALPVAARALQGAGDSNFKYHAASTVCTVLQRCRAVWQQLAAGDGGSSGDGGAAAGAAAAAPAPAAGTVLPWLTQEARGRLMGILWYLVDEPASQTLRQVRGGDQCGGAARGWGEGPHAARPCAERRQPPC
jgi:hypothetical protein